jgi:tyrosine-protein kinase Etk/Wzc
MTTARQLDLSTLLEVVSRRRRSVIRTLVVFLVAGVALAFLLPPTYEGAAVILAPQDNDPFGSIAGARRALSSFSALSLLSQGTTASDEFVTILKSDNVARAVARRFDLPKVYRVKSLDKAVRILKSNTRVALESDGSISVTVSDRDRARAADLANAHIEELERFNQERRVNRSSALVQFLQTEVESTSVQLRASEEMVRRYGEVRHAPIVSAEDRAAAEGAAALLARRAALQVQRQVLSSYLEPNSDELAQTDIQIGSVNREIAKLPSLMMGGARLVRDLKVQEELFALLKAQLEQARFKRVFDVPTVEILDRAHPPEQRSSPNRKLLLAGMMVLGLLTALAAALLQESWERNRRP